MTLREVIGSRYRSELSACWQTPMGDTKQNAFGLERRNPFLKRHLWTLVIIHGATKALYGVEQRKELDLGDETLRFKSKASLQSQIP